MSIIQRVKSFFGFDQRVLDLPDDLKRFYGANALSGEAVTKDTALQVAAVYACVRILSGTFASLPLHTYRTDVGGQVVARDHYLYDLLRHKVNPYTTAYRWKRHMVASLCLTGNHYSQIIAKGRNQVLGLYPLNSSRMKVTLADGNLIYEYKTDNGLIQIPSDEILHVRNVTLDGFTGLSPIDCAREAIGTALSTQRHTASFFRNGASLSSVVKVPTNLDATKAKELEEAFTAKHSGTRQAHTPLFLYGGMELDTPSMNFEQLQFFAIAEIRRC